MKCMQREGRRALLARQREEGSIPEQNACSAQQAAEENQFMQTTKQATKAEPSPSAERAHRGQEAGHARCLLA